MKNVDDMSNTKPIGKMNKAELLELAKENKDDIRIKDMKLTSVYTDNELLEVRLSEAIDSNRLLKEAAKINQKVLNRYNAQKQLGNEVLDAPIGKYKIPREPWCRRLKLWFKSLLK